MQEWTPVNKESIGNELIEDINQLQNFALGEGAAICQICGSKRLEGDAITAYAFRPAGTPTFRLGFVTCTDCSPITRFTLGVRELVVEGRIGTCADVATQSSWPVLLEPSPRVVSPACATVGHHPHHATLEATPEPRRAYTDGGTR